MTPSRRSAQKRTPQPIPQPLEESVPVLPQQSLKEAAGLSYYNSTFMKSDLSTPYNLVQVSSSPYFRRATEEELRSWLPALPLIPSPFMSNVGPIPVDPRLEGVSLNPQMYGMPLKPQSMSVNSQLGGFEFFGLREQGYEYE